MNREQGAKEQVRLSRRGFLSNSGKIAAGATVAAAGLTMIAVSQPEATAASGVPAYPWAYKKLDPEAVYWKAYASYYKNGCSQAAFEAIVTELGSPFDTVPVGMLKFGEGGIVGWGSHCGALTGSSAAITLAFPSDYAKMINDLNGWYAQELGSGAVLCHVSLTEWCKANGVKVESQERKDRCARVSGETAKKAVQMMNAQTDGQFKAVFVPTTSTTGCQSCHGANGRQDVRAGVSQDCVTCHGEQHQQ